MSIEEEILTLEATWGVAPLEGDLETVSRVTADDWIGVSSIGAAMSKADLLEMLSSHPARFESGVYDEVQLHVYGQTAVVTSLLRGEGEDLKLEQRFIRVYANRDGPVAVCRYSGCTYPRTEGDSIVPMSPLSRLRTLSARLITRYLHRPRSLVVRAWFWLAAQTDDLNEKHRCLEAILELEPDSESALGAVQWVLHQQQGADSIHPANAEELANIAEEAGAEVLRGALRYPSESGGWQLIDLDLSEYLAKYRD